MPTITVPRDQLHKLNPGDRIVALDGITLRRPHVVADLARSADGPVPLVNGLGTDTTWSLYQHAIAANVTVERADPAPAALPPKPEPAASREDDLTAIHALGAALLAERTRLWNDPVRTLRALKRNPQYVELLLVLEPHGDELVDLRKLDNVNQHQASAYSRTAGAVAGHYGWVDKPRAYRARITDRGRRALAIARANGLAR